MTTLQKPLVSIFADVAPRFASSRIFLDGIIENFRSREKRNDYIFPHLMQQLLFSRNHTTCNFHSNSLLLLSLPRTDVSLCPQLSTQPMMLEQDKVGKNLQRYQTKPRKNQTRKSLRVSVS